MLSPPSAKKLSSMPTPLQPQHLGEQRAQQLLLRACAARDARPPRELRRRQRRGRACRSASAAADPAPPAPPAPCSPASCADQLRTQRRDIQRRARRRHHIGDQPLAARAHPRAPPPPPAQLRACRSSAASISPGSIRNPRSFTCSSARPRNSSTPSARQRARSPVRYIRLPAAPERVGHEPLRRQPRTPQIAARQTRARNVELARHPRRHRLQATRPARRPACSQIGRPIGTRRRSASVADRDGAASTVALGRPVDVDAAATRTCRPTQRSPTRPCTPRRQTKTTPADERIVSARADACQQRRHAADDASRRCDGSALPESAVSSTARSMTQAAPPPNSAAAICSNASIERDRD